MMYELGRYLVGRGHQTTTFSTRQEGQADETTEAGRRVLCSPIAQPWMAHFRIQPTHLFFFSSARWLRSIEADAIHSFFFTDALAAALNQHHHKACTILQMNGVAIPGYSCRRWLPPEAKIYRAAIQRADVPIACSRWVANLVREHYGRDCIVVPPPVNADYFTRGNGPADGHPTILSVGDFTVRRKGVRVLLAAFRIVHEKNKSARLRLSGKFPDELRHKLLNNLPESVRANIEVLGLGRIEDVPRQYRESTITVLPAVHEPSGGALLESLASGTPVVVANQGGFPEFINKEVGVLFDPKSAGVESSNYEGLAEAISQGLELAEMPGTRDRCRAHAERFSWQALGPVVEELYRTGNVAPAGLGRGNVKQAER